MKENLIDIISHWKRSMLMLSIAPIVMLGVTFIIYGTAFNPFIIENGATPDFFKLPSLLSLFNSGIILPIIVKSLGRVSVILLTSIFFLWLSSFTLASYLKLSQRVACKIELIFEVTIISLVYYFIISPVNVFVCILGWIVLASVLVLIIFYWVYEVKVSR